MGKTWKDKPRNVEDVPVYKRRKKSPKPQPEDAEAEMLREQGYDDVFGKTTWEWM